MVSDKRLAFLLMKHRAVIRYLVLKGKAGNEIQSELTDEQITG